MLKNMKQTAEAAGVTYTAIQSALFYGRLPEPAIRVGRERGFNEAEVEAVRQHFAALREKRERVRK